MHRPFALGSAATVLLVLIIALALYTPTTQGQTTGPLGYIALADAKTRELLALPRRPLTVRSSPTRSA